MFSIEGNARPALSTTSQETEVPLCSLMNLFSVCLRYEECSKAWGPGIVPSCLGLKGVPVLAL